MIKFAKIIIMQIIDNSHRAVEHFLIPKMTYQFLHRPRRLRSNPIIRSLVEENYLKTSDFVLPVFISEEEKPSEVLSMPGVFRWPISNLCEQIKDWHQKGLKAFALFPKISPELKNEGGNEILNPNSLVCRAAAAIKQLNLDVVLIADLALDPYTTHGQDGIVDSKGEVDNDSTVEILAKASIVYANAGIDWVAPSDMMDGRIKIIREALERNSFHNTGIISYSAKFSSSYYGPFRSAIGSSMDSVIIDKSTYQLNPANLLEAQRELALDAEEGADILMVKPAEPFLDVIKQARSQSNLPIAAYQVSGEYSRIMAANQLGWLDWKSCALESLVGIKRAGANIIFSYFADRLAKDL